MESFGPKKLALIRIWQILKDYSDYDHPLTQEDISKHLENEYGIVIERKAISRNLSLLKEAGLEIESRRAGSYLECRDFEDSELHMLIDGVLSSKHITAKHSKDLINRICRRYPDTKTELTTKGFHRQCLTCMQMNRNGLTLWLMPELWIRLLTGLEMTLE